MKNKARQHNKTSIAFKSHCEFLAKNYNTMTLLLLGCCLPQHKHRQDMRQGSAHWHCLIPWRSTVCCRHGLQQRYSASTRTHCKAPWCWPAPHLEKAAELLSWHCSGTAGAM
jgi:hypothetical protein